MHKSRNWLAALTLVGLLAFQAVPAFADVVITCKVDSNPSAAKITITVSYGPEFNGNIQTLQSNVFLSRVNADGSRTGVPIGFIAVDPADPTHKTLTVSSTPAEQTPATYEVRIKPGATVPSSPSPGSVGPAGPARKF